MLLAMFSAHSMGRLPLHRKVSTVNDGSMMTKLWEPEKVSAADRQGFRVGDGAHISPCTAYVRGLELSK